MAQLCLCPQIDACHNEITGKAMARVVPVKIRQSGFLPCGHSPRIGRSIRCKLSHSLLGMLKLTTGYIDNFEATQLIGN